MPPSRCTTPRWQPAAPSAVKALATDSEHIAVSWRGSAGAFRLEYALNEDFAGDVSVVEPVEGNKYTVGELAEATAYYFRVMALSDKTGVSSSEYSAVVTARTLTEPKIPNVKAFLWRWSIPLAVVRDLHRDR